MSLPIIRRELLGALRSRRAVIGQIVLVSTLAGLVLLRWPADARVDRAAEASRQVLRVFTYGLTAALILIAPVFPAAAIVEERTRNTLPLLLHSPLTPAGIVGGKFISALGHALLLLVLSLPGAAACYALGGLSLSTLLGLYGVLAVLAAELTGVALLVSAVSRSLEAALRGAYAAVLGVTVAAAIPWAVLQGVMWAPESLLPVAEWLRCISPLPAVMELLGDAEVASVGGRAVGGTAWRFAGLGLLVAVVCTGGAVARLATRPLDRARDSGRVTDEMDAAGRAGRRVMFLWFFDPNRRSRMIGRWQNPVAVKEARSRRFGRGHWLIRLVFLTLIASLALMLLAVNAAVDWSVESLGGLLVLLQAALIVGVTPSLAGGMIAAERQSGSWRLLQMTPLGPGTIVWGKLRAAGAPLALVLLATLPAYGILAAIDPSQRATVARVLLTLLLLAGASLLVTAAVSACVRTAAGATAVSYGLLLAVCGGTLLVWLAEDAPFGRGVVEAVLRVNPVAAALSAMGVGGAGGFGGYDLLPVNWWVMVGVMVVSLAVLLARVWRLRRPE